MARATLKKTQWADFGMTPPARRLIWRLAPGHITVALLLILGLCGAYLSATLADPAILAAISE